ncbi:hypothetical protein [Pandoraea pnomenusa]|uniref:hypothetical protein n=1 Tax=Pandoraea pnomenusa TaxID=93220 RepID=UPI0007BCA1C9|nr:hypothetical protein [Pandoraea pnomenusa]ANC44116.1 hypothetical protein A6P55_07710 [Pandoraea pnomenusa]
MKFPYFKIKDAFDDARDSFSYGGIGDKAASVAKLVGKTVANAGMLATEVGVEVVKGLPEHMNKKVEEARNQQSKK